MDMGIAGALKKPVPQTCQSVPNAGCPNTVSMDTDTFPGARKMKARLGERRDHVCV